MGKELVTAGDAFIGDAFVGDAFVGHGRGRRGKKQAPSSIPPVAQQTAQKNVAKALNSKNPQQAAAAKQTVAVLATSAKNGNRQAFAHLRAIRNFYRIGTMSGDAFVGDAFVGGEDTLIGASLGALCGADCYRKGL